MTSLLVRQALPEDAGAIGGLYTAAPFLAGPRSAAEFELLSQTGHAFLVAARGVGGKVEGAVRWWTEEGIGWFDLLVSARPWAGAELVRAVERGCQDRGIRLLRCHIPDIGIYTDYFARLGHLPIGSREDARGEPELLLERRLPLLTVREQRRSDAAAIAAITGQDPWVFEQGALPGWFVAADGEKVVGVISCTAGARGLARIGVPALQHGYSGRGIELWMIARAAEYAETNGYHTAEMDAAPLLDPLRKGLEAAYWAREDATWRRVFFTPRSESEEDDW